jgi:hypothetical protein
MKLEPGSERDVGHSDVVLRHIELRHRAVGVDDHVGSGAPVAVGGVVEVLRGTIARRQGEDRPRRVSAVRGIALDVDDPPGVLVVREPLVTGEARWGPAVPIGRLAGGADDVRCFEAYALAACLRALPPREVDGLGIRGACQLPASRVKFTNEGAGAARRRRRLSVDQVFACTFEGSGTIRMYGFGSSHSPNSSFASSFETEPAIITSSPGCHCAGVETL